MFQGHALIAASFVLMAFGEQAARYEIPADLRSVIERTRTTKANYALYMWNEFSPARGDQMGEWSAEFHSGDLHRVETPAARIIANCRTMTGTIFYIETKKTQSGEKVAKSACGIDANEAVLRAVRVPAIETPFGRSDGVALFTQDMVRTYHVAQDGILLAISYKPYFGGRALTNWAVQVDRSVPDPAMFTEKSLKRSFVPRRYKVPANKPQWVSPNPPD